MSNLAKTLKDEITRIAKREAKQMVAAQTKITSELKRRVADLKKQVVELEKARKPVEQAIAKIQPKVMSVEPTEKDGKQWFTGKGIRSIRNRLGLTQPMFGKLLGIGVSGVTKWETTKGKVGLKRANRDKLVALRGMTKKAAWDKLGLDIGKSAPSTGKPAAKTERVAGAFTGHDIRTLRKRLGLSQKEFGRKLGYSQKGVSKWENKEGAPLQLPAKTVTLLKKLGE